MKNYNIPEVTECGNHYLARLLAIFEDAHTGINEVLPVGRESAIVATRMQEAYLFAYQAICHAHKRDV